MLRTTLWIIGLFVGSISWALLLNTAVFGPPASFQEEAGIALGMGGPVFVGAGIVAGIVYAVSKNQTKSLWTWTILLLIALVALSSPLLRSRFER